MDLMEAIWERHSVRAYTDEPLSSEVVATLSAEIKCCNAESGLHIQLVRNEPKAFTSMMAKYGKFSNVQNYIALVGNKDMADLDERCGYYGERLVLLAQQHGLNTCWVGMTFKKVPGAYQVSPEEKLVIVIAIGHGQTQGSAHQIKVPENVCANYESTPDWFKRGIEMALLAPTAVNQQKFFFTYEGEGRVHAKAGRGFFSKVDLGIVKYHFEIGATPQEFSFC